MIDTGRDSGAVGIGFRMRPVVLLVVRSSAPFSALFPKDQDVMAVIGHFLNL